MKIKKRFFVQKKMQRVEILKLGNLFNDILLKYNVDLSNYAAASLERRIERFLALHHFDDARKLGDRLLTDPVFFDLFVKEITVNTTEMFRDPSCWQVMRNEILPVVAAHPGIRIWHAGCSSGEEVYSMAIMLKEEGLYEKAKIIASDLNREVMQVAMNGTYSMKSLEINEENYQRAGGKAELASYYERTGAVFKMKKELLENVRFLKHDLSTGESFSKFDIILCRNVLIYFNKQLQEKVFQVFRQSLFKRGFIVIGRKESMAYYSGYSQFSDFSLSEKIYRLK